MWSRCLSSRYSWWRLVNTGRGVWRAILLSLKQTPTSGQLSSSPDCTDGADYLAFSLPAAWLMAGTSMLRPWMSVSTAKNWIPPWKPNQLLHVAVDEKEGFRLKSLFHVASDFSEVQWHWFWWVGPFKRSLQQLSDSCIVGWLCNMLYKQRQRGHEGMRCP